MTDRIRVLVVDDDFRVAGLHRDMIAGLAGFEVVDAVHTAADARRVVRAQRPDLVVLDVHLPDGDGISLAGELDVDVLIVSAETDAAQVRRAIRAGAVGYLVKPFDSRALGEKALAYARYRNVLSGRAPVDQETIDRALRILGSAEQRAGRARSATEQLMIDALGEVGEGAEISALEIAERTGVSRATAQRYLASLAAQGIAEVTLRYGSTGRPEHRYRLAAAAAPGSPR